MNWWMHGAALLVLGLLERDALHHLGSAAPLFMTLAALSAMRHDEAAPTLAAWWLAGFLRDLLAGSHLGMSSVLFLLTGLALLALRNHMDVRLPAVQALLAAVATVIIRGAEFLFACRSEPAVATAMLSGIASCMFFTIAASAVYNALPSLSPRQPSMR